jgi:hypothetical protein
MKIDTLTAGNIKVEELLTTGRVGKTVSVEDSSTFLPPTVVIDQNGSDWQFSLGRDGKWRLGSVSTWGNWQGISGDACGASGFTVRDREQAEILDDLVS